MESELDIFTEMRYDAYMESKLYTQGSDAYGKST